MQEDAYNAWAINERESRRHLNNPQTIRERVSALFNQMMVEGIADEFGGGRELQLVQKTGSIGADGLDAESEGLCDVLDGLALG